MLADGVGILMHPEDGAKLASEIERLATEYPSTLRLCKPVPDGRLRSVTPWTL